MEKEMDGKPSPKAPAGEPVEEPPAFQPDPEIVTWLERGRRDDPKRVWKAESGKRK